MLKKFFNDKDKNSINYHMKEVKNIIIIYKSLTKNKKKLTDYKKILNK